MNPMYKGRTELPDNLKSLFRPVSMIIPDSLLISEILLYSYGFHEAKSLAQKIVYTFYLAKQQLSQQVHYDFGLRAIKIILSSAGVLKLKASGIGELGTKFTDDLKVQSPQEKEKRLDANMLGGIGDGTGKSRDANQGLAKLSKGSRRAKKSFLKKQTTRLQKEIKLAQKALKNKDIHEVVIKEEKGAEISDSENEKEKEDKIEINSFKSSDDISIDEESKSKSKSKSKSNVLETSSRQK